MRSTSSYLHAKVWCFDNSAYVGSSNLADNALSVGREPSIEAGIIFRREDDVAVLKQQLKMIWASCSLKQQSVPGDIYVVEDGGKSLDPALLASRSDGGATFGWHLPQCDAHPATEALIKAIQSAEQTVRFVAMSFYDLGRVPGLFAAIIEALARGVHVRAVVRHPYFRPDQYPDRDTRRLLNAGMHLEGLPRLHAKGAAVDGRWALLFSGNFNPYSLAGAAESDHVELGVWGPCGVPELDAWADWIGQVRGSWRWSNPER